MRNATKVGPFLFCLLLLPGMFFAETEAKKKNEAQAIFAEGQKRFRNSDYAGAAELFEKYSTIETGDPKGPWMELKAFCFFLRACSSADDADGSGSGDKLKKKPDDVAYAKAMLLAKNVAEKTEEKIAKGEDVGFYQFISADTCGLRGVFQKAHGDWRSAITSAECMRDLAKKSDYQDAKYLLGLAEYELSLKNWFYRLGGKLKGFPSNRDEALRLIHEAEADNTGQFSDDIRFLIFQILTDTRLKDKERLKAEEVFKVKTNDLYARLKAAYPNNKKLLNYGKTKK